MKIKLVSSETIRNHRRNYLANSWAPTAYYNNLNCLTLKTEMLCRLLCNIEGYSDKGHAICLCICVLLKMLLCVCPTLVNDMSYHVKKIEIVSHSKLKCTADYCAKLKCIQILRMSNVFVCVY